MVGLGRGRRGPHARAGAGHRAHRGGPLRQRGRAAPAAAPRRDRAAEAARRTARRARRLHERRARGARRPPLRQVVPRRRARLPRRAAEPARPGRLPARRGRASTRGARLVRRGAASPSIPYGGGSSVVGGVETAIAGRRARSSSLDLGRLDRVLEIDRASRAARIQAGVLGPALEDQLRPHGLTLRHFPQSFEFSTLGGWIATRSGGHYATLYTHIDDFVESLRVVTPAGVVETRRLPASGAGPSPDRLFIGSEGILGVITEAWMRLQDRPTLPRRRLGPLRRARRLPARRRGGAAARPVRAPSFELPAARPAGGADLGRGRRLARRAGARLRVGRPPLRTPGSRARSSCAATRAARRPSRRSDARSEAAAREDDGPAGAWRRAFLQAPYVRDVLVACSRDRRDLRDRDPLERLPGLPSLGDGGDARRRPARLRRRQRDVPLHPRVPGRRRALLQRARAGPAGQRARAVGRDQGGGERRASSAAGAPSRTTTRSGATTARATTASGPSSSPPPSAPRSAPSTPAAC